MSTGKKKFGGRYEHGGKAKGAVEELGKHVYVCEVQGANNKFIKTTEKIADYVGRELGKPMSDLVTGKDNPPKEPEALPASVKKDSHESRKWDKDYDHYLRQKDIYELNKGKVFVIIKGQCTLAVKNKLNSLGAEYAQLEQDIDVIGLLKAIRNIALENAEIQFEHWAAAQALKRLAMVNQHGDEDLPQFYKRWTNARDVAELQWGPLYPTKLVTQTQVEDGEEIDGESGETRPKYRIVDNSDEVRNQFQACLYLAGVHHGTHGTVTEELCHQYLNKQNNYPKTVEDAMTMLSHRLDTAKARKTKKDKEKTTKTGDKPTTSFTQKKGGKKSKYTKKKSKNDSESDDDSSQSSKSSKGSRTGRTSWSNAQTCAFSG